MLASHQNFHLYTKFRLHCHNWIFPVLLNSSGMIKLGLPSPLFWFEAVLYSIWHFIVLSWKGISYCSEYFSRILRPHRMEILKKSWILGKCPLWNIILWYVMHCPGQHSNLHSHSLKLLTLSRTTFFTFIRIHFINLVKIFLKPIFQLQEVEKSKRNALKRALTNYATSKDFHSLISTFMAETVPGRMKLFRGELNFSNFKYLNFTD